MKSLYIDAEGALDPEWIDALGIPRDTFYILRTAEGNEALTAAEAMLRADDIGLVVIDSIAHLLPAVEVDRPMGEKMVASLASLVTHAVVKLQVRMNTEEARGHPCAVIATNQLRFIIGAGLYANPETESGGQSFKHWFSLGMRMSKLSTSDSLLTTAEKSEVKTYQRHGLKWDKERFSTFLGAAEFLRAREDIYDIKNADNLLYTKGSVIDDMVIEKYLKQLGMIGDGSWEVPGLYDGVKLQKELRTLLRNNDEKYYQLHIEMVRRAKQYGCRSVQRVSKPDVVDAEGYDIPI
jgi:RecA/RadA recombinase